MTTQTTYNGWTNYETWLVKLWIDNSEADQLFWNGEAEAAWNSAEADDTFTKRERAALDLMNQLREQHEEIVSETVPVSGFIADLIGAAMSEVNWHEIAESLLEDVEESEE